MFSEPRLCKDQGRGARSGPDYLLPRELSDQLGKDSLLLLLQIRSLNRRANAVKIGDLGHLGEKLASGSPSIPFYGKLGTRSSTLN